MGGYDMENNLKDLFIIFDARKQEPEGPAIVKQLTDDLGMAMSNIL